MSESLLELARRGARLDDVLVIDGHAHLGPWQHFHIPEPDLDGMVRVMDRVGIDRIFLAPHASIGSDFQLGNDLALEAMGRYPGRVFGYLFVNPNHEDGVLDELRRCERLGASSGHVMRQIKVHSMNGYPYDGERYRSAYDYANERGFPILAHTWGKDAQVFDPLSEEYPNIRFILGHSGVSDFDTYVHLAKKRPNIYLDLATSMVGYGWVERFVEEVGSDRLLFGSDMPFISAPQQIGKVLYARISEEDKRKILGLNAARVFGLDG